MGSREVCNIWYNDPNFSMHIPTNDKGAKDIADLCKVHLGVDVFVQHPVS